MAILIISATLATKTAAADTNPPTGTVTINGGAPSTGTTSVTLTLSATDAEGPVTKMKFSNDNITWSSPQPYQTTKSWTLTSGDGTKTVYVDFKDGASANGNWMTTPATASIILDGATPSIPTELGAAALNSWKVFLSFDASTDDVAVVGYKIYRNGFQVATTTGSPYLDLNLSSNTIYTYTVTAYDADGHESLQPAGVSVTTMPLKFSTGERAKTSSSAGVRNTPSLSGTLAGTQGLNARGMILAGPIFADGNMWWNVNYDSGADGWSQELWLEKEAYYKIPVSFGYHPSPFDQAPFNFQSDNPLIEMAQAQVFWSVVEPARGTFDWTKLDQLISDWTANGKQVWLQIPCYNEVHDPSSPTDDNVVTPSWIYDLGVPRITFLGSGISAGIPCADPQVWDPDYYPIYEEFVQAVTARYNNDPRVAGYYPAVGHLGGLTAQSSALGAAAFQSNGWTMAVWETHISQVLGIWQAHATKPLRVFMPESFLGTGPTFRVVNQLDAAKRIVADIRNRNGTILFHSLTPDRNHLYTQTGIPDLVTYLGSLGPKAGFSMGFTDDWPLWVPQEVQICPGPTCGHDVDGYDLELSYVFELWDGINRSIPIFIGFVHANPQTEATGTNPNGPLFVQEAYEITTKWLFVPPPPPPSPGIARSGNNIALSWPAISGFSYQVQWSADLLGWTNAGAALGIPASASSLSWSDDGTQTGTPPSQVTRRFYRVQVSP